jgi:hypothetical protein
VQLSYNGSRKHHTIPGAICSIISMMLMALMFWGVFRKMTGHDYTNVVRNNHQLLLNQADPPAYDINHF